MMAFSSISSRAELWLKIFEDIMRGPFRARLELGFIASMEFFCGEVRLPPFI